MFYTTLKDLPVITPSSVPMFQNIILEFLNDGSFGDQFPRISLWTGCSGSSRLALIMLSAPFNQLVLFPVDLRYGWDLRLPEHQQLSRTADRQFSPM
eukprot:2349861-Pyramimonas_sp.AAC.1